MRWFHRPTRVSRGFRALLVGLFAGLSAFTTSLVTSVAPAGAAPSLQLASIPAWVAPGAAVPVVVSVGDTDASAEIGVTVHSAVTSRTAFEQSVEGRGLGSAVARANIPVGATASGGSSITLPLQLADGSSPATETTLAVRRTGVYPMRIELRVDGTVVSELITHLVVADATPERPAVGQRLGVGLVVPLIAEPTYLPDGSPDPDVVASFAPTGRLGRIGSAVATHATPLTVLPGPETLQSWAGLIPDRPDLFDGPTSLAAQSVTTHQVVSAPYVPLDFPSLLRHELGDRVPAQLAAGADALNTTEGRRIDPRTMVLTSADQATLASLREAGVDRVVVPSAQVLPVDNRFTAAEPFALDVDGRRFAAFESRDELVKILATTNAYPAQQVQQFLSWLSLVALEQPNRARAIVANFPELWDPSSALLDALLRGLTDHPLLAASTLDQLFARLATDSAALTSRQLTPIDPATPPVTASQLDAASADLASFASLTGSDDPAIASGTRSILTSMTSLWNNRPGRARAQLAAITGSVEAFARGIQLAGDRTITITARRATVPVAVLNDTGAPVRVRISIASNRLFFPEGSEQIVELPARSSTVDFEVEARASGTFPLDVNITSIDDHLTLASSRVTVRSTVVSGVGVVIAVTASVFLLGWWALHFRRTRRRAVPTAVPTPTESVSSRAAQ